MKSILIGIDGAEPSLIEKWSDELPNLQKFIFTKLESTLPPSSAPAWTSIVTGVEPNKHGIYDFFYFDGKIKLISSLHRRVPAIWNLLDSIGRKSIVVNVPVTFPPEKINGVMVSGLLTPPKANFVLPIEAKKFLKGYKMEHLLIDDLPIRIASYYQPEKVFNLLISWIDARTKAFINLLKNYEWDFSMLVYRATDLAQHFLDDEYVFQIYKKIDDSLGKIMHFKANYFIVSDHGFCKIKKNIYVNNLLYEKGYIKLIKKKKTLKTGKKIARLLNLLPRKFTYIPFVKKILFSIAMKENLIDFNNSKAFCLSSSSRAVLVRKNIKEEVINLLKEIKEILEIKELPYDYAKEWDYLVIDLKDGYFIMDLLNFEKILAEPEKFHFKREHAKHGIFMAYGNEFKEIEEKANVIDVLPTIFHSMKLPIPLHIDGKVLDVFKKEEKVKKVDWQKYGISKKELDIIKEIATKHRL